MISLRTPALKITALLVALAAPALAAAGPYAAIAYSPSTGKYGTSRNYPTRGEADRAAIANCGAADARVVVWASGGSYCALAVDPGNPAVYGRDFGSTAARARVGAATRTLVVRRPFRSFYRLPPLLGRFSLLMGELAGGPEGANALTYTPKLGLFQRSASGALGWPLQVYPLPPTGDGRSPAERWGPDPVAPLRLGGWVGLLGETPWILNVTFGPDLTKFVREGNTRDLFKNRAVVSLLTGEPEYLDPLKDETPEGWIVTGYPWQDIKTPEHAKFVEAYQKRFNDYPRLGSIVGYATFQAVGEALKKAGSTDTEKLVAAMQGLPVDTPFGPITYRAIDHQSTMGAYVGRTAVRDGKGMMVDWRYADGKDYLPPDDVVRRLRPAD